ncbi:MAG: polysaccharide biosynthesis/export family protein [Planctomycetota bacterium]
MPQPTPTRPTRPNSRATDTAGLRLLTLLALALLLAFAPACQPVHTDYSAFIQTPRPTVAPETYRLAPPDQIAFTSQRVREIDGLREIISPDGHIHLPLVGSIFVAGKSIPEVANEVQMAAAQYYEDADVAVRVTRFASKKIFVFGQVSTPGAYPYTGTNTILRTLASAQPNTLADTTKIQVLRPSADGDVRRLMTVDLDLMIQYGDTTLDAVLEEGDILFIPPTPLAAAGLGLRQLLLPIQPAAAVVQGPADIAEETSGRRPYGTTN